MLDWSLFWLWILQDCFGWREPELPDPFDDQTVRLP